MKRHGTDAVSLGFGAAFLSVVAWWLLTRLVEIAMPAFGWFVAGALVVFGVVGLLVTARSGWHAANR